jgi:hypothetical protein
MPVRDMFYANPHSPNPAIYFLIMFRSSHYSPDSLFFPSNTITIILMNLFCTSCSWTWLEPFTAKISKSSPSRVIWACWFESSHFSYWTRVESLKIVYKGSIIVYWLDWTLHEWSHWLDSESEMTRLVIGSLSDSSCDSTYGWLVTTLIL